MELRKLQRMMLKADTYKAYYNEDTMKKYVYVYNSDIKRLVTVGKQEKT